MGTRQFLEPSGNDLGRSSDKAVNYHPISLCRGLKIGYPKSLCRELEYVKASHTTGSICLSAAWTLFVYRLSVGEYSIAHLLITCTKYRQESSGLQNHNKGTNKTTAITKCVHIKVTNKLVKPLFADITFILIKQRLSVLSKTQTAWWQEDKIIFENKTPSFC